MTSLIPSVNMMLGGLTAGIVATNICLSGLSSMCQSAISYTAGLVKGSQTTGTEEITRLVVSRDLEATLKKINVFITDMASFMSSKRIISLSIEDITDIICKIQETLSEIKIRKDYQDSLYFGNTRFRSYDYSDLHSRLQSQIDVLQIRFDYLVKILPGVMTGQTPAAPMTIENAVE